MIFQLQKYDIHIIHRPGKEIPVADTLSGKSIKYHDSALHEGVEARVHMVLSSIPVSDKRLSEIKEATANDPLLTTLRNATLACWPDTRKRCPPSIQQF